ncbi:MAG: BamA/TamA family outer membrane protein [Verrucomicrobia subdivision 3 bacterium]|nr:BamA/TamA family outer membrane protein [Limisphaerales bacterium]
MKTNILKTTVLALLLAAPLIIAQPAAAPPKVGEVKVTLTSFGSGDPDITEAYVRNHIRIRPGDEFRPGMTNPGVHALMQTGRFHNVRVDASEENGKITLTFVVVAYPKVTSVDLLLRRPDGTTLTAASLQIKEKDLLKKITLRKGSRYSDAQRQADAKALREHYEDKGYYRVSVTSEAKRQENGKLSGAVEYYITEGEQFQIENMTFEGNENFDSDDLMDFVKARERRRWFNPISWFTNDGRIRPLELQADIDRLETYYRNRGYLDAKVQVAHTADEVLAGETYQHHINTLNKARADLELLELSLADEEGKGDAADEDRLDLLEDKVDDQEDVVDDAEDELEDFLDDASYVDLVFKITEGRRYHVGTVDFEYYWQNARDGETTRLDAGPDGAAKPDFKPVIPKLTLISLIRMREGEVYAPESLLRSGPKSDLRSIKNYYGRKSHINARVLRVVRKPVTGTDKINLVFRIFEGNPFNLELVQIEGNEKTKDFVIRRELAVSAGERFDLGRVDRSRRRIEGMQIFESVRTFPRRGPDARQDANPGETLTDDLVVAVREKNTGTFMIGGGFSTDSGAFANIITGQENFDIKRWRRPHLLQGAGQKIRLKAVAGGRYSNYRLDFEEPWLLDRKLKFTTALYVEEMSYYSSKFDVDQTGFTMGLERTLLGNDFLRGKLYFTLEEVGLVNLESTTSTELKNEAGHDFVGLLGGRLAYDTRGGGDLPSKGQLTSFDLMASPSIIGSDKPFYGYHLKSTWYFKGLREGHVLELRAQNAVVDSFESGKNVPYLYRHHLGGSRNLRGFDFNEVGPRGDQNDYLRGETMAHASVEYSIPTPWEILRIATFYDIGSVNKGAYDFDFGNYNDDWGIGLRLQIPFLGPLRLDYAFPITDDGYNDSSGNINVNFGYTTRF